MIAQTALEVASATVGASPLANNATKTSATTARIPAYSEEACPDCPLSTHSKVGARSSRVHGPVGSTWAQDRPQGLPERSLIQAPRTGYRRRRGGTRDDARASAGPGATAAAGVRTARAWRHAGRGGARPPAGRRQR